jgi:hypothetical protein
MTLTFPWVSTMPFASTIEPGARREARIEALIEHRLGNRIHNLRVFVRPMGLILEGFASTYYAKQLAQHTAMELASLPILANDIDVF